MKGSLVDDSGNINVQVLEKELKEALEFDVKYKQTDNMKKRACKQAKDYDEFKAMVDCAHLKKLSKEEVETLGHAKKGWKKGTDKISVEIKPLILMKEREATCVSAMKPNTFDEGNNNIAKKPTNSIELQRVLRTTANLEEKLSYLKFVGTKRCKRILYSTSDADLIEDILNILLFTRDESKCENRDVPTVPEHDVASNATILDKTQEDQILKSAESKKNKTKQMKVKWLTMISELDHFNMMVRFLSKQLLLKITEDLEMIGNESILKKYKIV